MASLNSIVILGADVVTAALPATAVQLVHACRRWGFASVVPASWGDELIAAHVIRRCAVRDDGPLVHCSCPIVSARLATNAALLESSVLWLQSPPVAVARYLREMESGRDLHITYAGDCPGASDPSIDQRITAEELLDSIRLKGIDLSAQPTEFADIIPPDRRRFVSSPGGFPDPHVLWEAAKFRVAVPTDGNLPAGIAQLLLTDDRLLVDLAPVTGCLCRKSGALADEAGAVPRAPSPVVLEGRVAIDCAPPTPPPATIFSYSPPIDAAPTDQPPPQVPKVESAPAALPSRHSPPRPALRRATVVRRQSPRPGALSARGTKMIQVVSSPSFFRRREGRMTVAAIVVTGIIMLMLGLAFGRRSATISNTSAGTAAPESAETTQLGHPR